MHKNKSFLWVFAIGAAAYGILEILWRGRTHWSMMLAGGFCFCSFCKIGERLKKHSLLIKGICGGVFITAVEFLFGIIFNIILKKQVWDYSKQPLNLWGQICLLYSFFWVLLSLVGIPAACAVERKFKGKELG